MSFEFFDRKTPADAVGDTVIANWLLQYYEKITTICSVNVVADAYRIVKSR